MLRIRTVSTAAATAIVFVLAVSGAAAQTASADQPGKPLSLLQLIKQTAATPTAAHAISANTAAKTTKIKKIASKKHNKVAAAQDPDSSADAAQSSASADAWLAASATPANTEQAVQSDNRQPENGQPEKEQAENGQPDLGPLPSSIQVGGQTVQVASADQVNEIDLAADNTQLAESTAPPSDRTDMTAAANAMAKAMLASPAALVAPVRADAGQTVTDQTASGQTTTTVGSASWIAQVLAALGGAIAAGAVAWFLLGTGPVRTYG
jgi:hypothetical protein